MIEYVNVGPGGTFEVSGDHVTKPGDIDTLFDTLASETEPTLVLHFHGGLVGEKAGVDIATRLAPIYRQAGVHPLTFVWETGVLETFRDNLARLGETKLFGRLLMLLVEHVVPYVGVVGVRSAGVPMSRTEIERELAQERPFDRLDDEATGHIATRGASLPSERDLLTLEGQLQLAFEGALVDEPDATRMLREHAGQEVDSGTRGLLGTLTLARILARIAFRVIRRFVHGRDHGVYPTIVEELVREIYLDDVGAWVWTRMKEKAEFMWRPNDGRDGSERFVGGYVLDAITRLKSKNAALRVHLVGHSAGAIAICHMLRAAAARNLDVGIDWVVFLAPAGRSELGVSEIVQPTGRFNRFRMYTMADEFESKDAMLGQKLARVYPRSLLYFISGVLEPDEVDAPLMGLMRHASGKGPFASGAAKSWKRFIDASQRTVLADSSKIAPNADDGFRTHARNHGAFDDDSATLASLAHVLRR